MLMDKDFISILSIQFKSLSIIVDHKKAFQLEGLI